ncbi:MAG: putative amidohydrolase [Friedmanniella sp.]|nr:putative amidohydrolase [Friedmanniella sp.]
MRIALAQIVAEADPGANLAQVERETARAAAAGADLVVFPEATMRAFGRSLTEVAEPLDGPWAEGVRAVAARHRVTVVVGMFTPATDGRVRNTLLVTGPGVEAAYDKIHLFDAYGFRESDTVAPGEDLVVVEVAGVRVGVAVCYDLRFPGLFTRLADLGAQVIALGASWGAGPGKVEAWEVLVRARALDSTTFVAAAGQADPRTVGQVPAGAAPTGIGHSLVAGPTGLVLAAAGAGPDLVVVDVDPGELDAVRASLPVLANRRF